MSFFSSLDVEKYDREYSDRQLAARMADYFRPYGRKVVLIVILLTVISLAGAISPWVVSRGVDILESNPRIYPILLISAILLILGVVVWLANWGRRRLTVQIVGDVVLAMRNEAFSAAASHDLSFYDEYSSGKVVSRITSDSNEFGQVVLLLSDLISQVILALILAVVLFSIEWRLALIMMVFVIVIFFSALGFRRLARTVTRKGMRAMANVNAAIKETVSGISVAKNFRQEAAIYDEFNGANLQSYRVNVQRGLVLSMVFPTLNAVGGIATAAMVYIGGISVIQGIVTAGAWFLFLQSLDRFFFPVLNLSSFWAQVQSGLSAAERVFALIDAESQVVQIDHLPVYRLNGDIRFEHVGFYYGRNEHDPVLENFNLHIMPGENIALVGHTGAGKSTIAKLIARFYEFQQGQLLLDGRDIRTFDLHDYRRCLGIVSQVPFLFSGTVLENICYACPDEPNVAEVELLARQIGNGDWLDSFPDGLSSEVGERGSRLSMGQRQLISLMRVLVQKPSIFILDEATASIDPFTESQIQQALDMILSETTSILIAHRLSTVKSADRIIVMENGRTIEEGNHDSLLAKGGHYASLYNTYFRHQSLDFRPTGLDEYLAEKKPLTQ